MQCNKPKKITLSRPPPKKRSKQVPSTSAYVKIAPTDWGAINAIKENTHNKTVSAVTKDAVSQRPRQLDYIVDGPQD